MRILRFPWICFLLLLGFGVLFFWLRSEIWDLNELQNTFEEYGPDWSRIERQRDDLVICSFGCFLGALLTVMSLMVHALIKYTKVRADALS